MKTSPRRCRRSWLVLLGFILTMGGAAGRPLVRPSSSEDSLPSALVAVENSSARARVALAGGGAKAKPVKLHPDLMRGARFKLDLPNGSTVTIVRDRLDDLGKGDFVWSGQVEGNPVSRVTLTSRKGTAVGMVELPWQDGTDFFELKAQADGQSVLVPVAFDGPACTDPRPGSEVGRAGDATPATELNPAVVDVMVVYSTTAKNAHGGQSGVEGMILTAIADANTANRTSQVHLLFNLVYMAEVDDGGTTDINVALDRLQNPLDGWMDQVMGVPWDPTTGWRGQYKADLVALVGEYFDAGVGYVMTDPDVSFESYAVCAVKTGALGNYSLHHEFGHILGSQHDHENASFPGAYPFSYGYKYCAFGYPAFRTIMSYQCASTSGYALRVNVISNPNITVNGLPAGVAYEADPVNAADNARSMNLTGPIAQQFRTGTVPPAGPSSLTVTATSSSTANVYWMDNSANEAGFRLERSADGVNWSVVATLAANLTQFSDAGLAAETTYSYRVRAYNGGGFSGYSNTGTLITSSAPPAAPSALKAAATSESLITLTWTDNATTEQAFKIERSVSGGAFAEVASLAPNATTWADNGVTAGTTYTYRVKACNSNGSSAWSNEASATPQLPSPPAQPSQLTATAISASQISLAWVDNANNETSQQLERSTDGLVWNSLATLGANVTTYQNTGLAAATLYSYRVRACNAGGCSEFSAPAAATTLPNPPAAPTGLGATVVSQTQISLVWVDNSSNETGFTIERSPNGSSWATVASLGASVTAWQDTSLGANTTCYYRVIAFNSGGNSASSNTAVATTLPNPPAAPTGLTAIAVSPTQINLAWADNASNETGFKLERSLDGVNFTVITTVGAGVTSYQNTGLTANTTYSYRVRATNTGGDSVYSNTASATTLPVPTLNPPGNVVVTAVSCSIVDLTWTDTSTGEDGSEIQRAGAGQDWTPIAWVGPNVTAYRDAGLAAQTAYSYRVLAFRGTSYSAASTTVSVSTPAFVARTITVTFNSIGTEDGYVLESGEMTNAGGSTRAGTAYVGDSNKDCQYKSIFSFDTSALPDGALIVSARLRLKAAGFSGTNPFQTHGPCLVDVKGGAGFGGSSALAAGDFSAAADVIGATSLSTVSAKGQWSEGLLNDSGKAAVNRTGRTQFRVYFQWDDNDDNGNDYVGLFTGGATTGSKPELVIEYLAP